jgi:hypothetical protein
VRSAEADGRQITAVDLDLAIVACGFAGADQFDGRCADKSTSSPFAIISSADAELTGQDRVPGCVGDVHDHAGIVGPGGRACGLHGQQISAAAS